LKTCTHVLKTCTHVDAGSPKVAAGFQPAECGGGDRPVEPVTIKKVTVTKKAR